MADQNNPHFKELFWFCVGIVLLGLAYLFCVTFIPIPPKNERTVDTVTGFILGTLIGSATGFLLGGNPTASVKPKLPDTADTLNVDSVNTIVKTADVK